MRLRFDVLIAGGGMAGCAAAIAAVREGASALLIERQGYLGGNATRAMVSPWQSFHASRNDAGTGLPPQIIGGIAQEFVDDLISLGGCLGHIVDPIGFAGSITPVDSEVLKLYLPAKLRECGVELSLSTDLTQEHLDSASQIVDTTGCAAAARMLGAEIVTPTDPQPMSWLFTMRDVDPAAVRDYQLAHLEQFVLHPGFTALSADLIAVSGFFDLVRQARESGEFTIPRDRLLFFSTPRRGEVLINTTRIPADHPAPWVEGLRQIRELVAWLPPHVPGFARARLGRIADAIGERESFRLRGRHTLSASDIRSGASHPEAIARGCYPIDIHRADSSELITHNLDSRGYYDIPLGCLESVSVPRLLCAGRCLSADRQGFASARVLPTAMATGQAAGMIAAKRARGKFVDNLPCLSAVSLV
jgi:hypothetical protein